eukprot:augustus_masked-scaffold_79-processed-gene-0.4-mRNA-1 protein AED:0.06 eAED:0.06 QI:0/-1/0/1/-1/1/1/0/508
MSETKQTSDGLFSVRDPSSAVSSENISYKDLVTDLRKTFDSGRTKELAWRKQQINQMKLMLKENHEAFNTAIQKDLGGPLHRGFFDMSAALHIDEVLSNLSSWSAPQKVKHNKLLGKSYIRMEPKGVLLIIAPWNYPLAMILDPMLEAIAAGNCVLIKPSEVSANTCEAVSKIFPKYFDKQAIQVVTGGVPETTALLKEKYDHIMYTGNGAVARIILKAAAEYLTPCTLELGGKSPVYVDKSARLDLAAKRVNNLKWLNYGQTCVAPDYIMIHEDIAEEFKKVLIEDIKNTYSKNVKGSVGKVITPGHERRVASLVDSSTGEVILGGRELSTPTLIDEPALSDDVFNQEIFGPVLPLKTVKNVQEAVEVVNEVCKTPLALYVFSEDQKSIDYFLDHTQSGGVAVNTAIEQLSNYAMPFGGFGDSGYGKYHGKWGFQEFSHTRSVLVRDTLLDRMLPIPTPPFNEKKMYGLLEKFIVTGFVSENTKKLIKGGAVVVAGAVGAMVLKSKL